MVPKWIAIALYIASFYVLSQQFRRGFTKRHLLNIRFLMMVGSLALALLTDFWSITGPAFSLGFLAGGIIWIVGSIVLWRRMPPVPPAPARF